MSDTRESSEQQDDAEADVDSFKEDLGPFVVAAETTRMPMVFTDARQANNSIIFANDSSSFPSSDTRRDSLEIKQMA